MTFVYHYKIKVILRQSRVWRKGYFFQRAGFFFIVIVACNWFPFKKSKEPLNGRYYYIGILGYGGGFQSRYTENGIKWISVFGQSIGPKLTFRLLAKIITVNKEKNSPHFCIIQEAIS